MEGNLNKSNSNPFISIVKECFSFLIQKHGYVIMEEKDNSIIQLIIYGKDIHRVSIGYEWRDQSFYISTYSIDEKGAETCYRSLYQYIMDYDPGFDFNSIRPLEGFFDNQHKKLYEPLKNCAVLFKKIIELK